MYRPASNVTPSTQISTDGDVFALIDQWVRQFELDTDIRRDPPTPTPAAPPKSAAPNEEPAEREPRALPLKSTGLFTTFTDPIGGSVSLARADDRLQHRGTVGVRGHGRAIESACQDAGLPGHVTRAFEFVAAWFGFPYDAVNVRLAEGQILSWGFWGFAGDDLIRCLDEWKRTSRETFDSHLPAFGIDVSSDSRTPRSNADERLTLVVKSGRRLVQGRDADWLVASQPDLLAVLARAGRDPSAQKAQIDSVIARSVNPLMFLPWNSSREQGELTLDVLTSAHAVAALLYIVRRHGLRTATRLMRVVNEQCGHQSQAEDWLRVLVRSLRNLNRESDAAEVLRIASSPELTMA
jgi:hypothetical protein